MGSNERFYPGRADDEWAHFRRGVRTPRPFVYLSTLISMCYTTRCVCCCGDFLWAGFLIVDVLLYNRLTQRLVMDGKLFHSLINDTYDSQVKKVIYGIAIEIPLFWSCCKHHSHNVT